MTIPRLLLILGIAMTAVGVGGTGYFYRAMKSENLKHARTGDIPLDFAATTTWQRAGFNVFRDGRHLLLLSVRNARRLPPRALTASGSVELEVLDGAGSVVHRARVTPALSAVPPADSDAIVPLGAFEVHGAGEEAWTLRARVADPDTGLAGFTTELSVLPPQLYEIGGYLEEKIVTLILMGACSLGGFILIVVAAGLQRRDDGAGA